jgi:hypothetical protein
MKSQDLDQKFDDGEDVLEYFDLSTLKRPGIETQKITLELPQWMLNAIDKEAKLLGVESQSLINIYLAPHLKVMINS